GQHLVACQLIADNNFVGIGFGSMHAYRTSARVDDPHQADTSGKILFDLFLDLVIWIVRRYNFRRDIGRDANEPAHQLSSDATALNEGDIGFPNAASVVWETLVLSIFREHDTQIPG